MNELVTIAAYVVTLGGALVYLNKIWKTVKNIAESSRCTLRSQVVEIYYRHNNEEDPELRQYERENLDKLYDGYKSLSGNSFVDDIYTEMRSWKVNK